MSRKEDLKDLLSISNGERKGITVLFLIVFFLLISYASVKFIKPREPVHDPEFEKEVAEFIKGLEPLEDENYESRLDKYIIQRYDTIELFDFDPNNTSENEWKKLGFTEKQISTIQNYIDKGGVFSDKEDFRKIYGIRQKQFEILKEYITLPENNNQNKYQNNFADNFKDYKSKISLNQKDSSLYFNPNKSTPGNWKKLGFSDKQTESIINYFDKGGKIFKEDDLKKIYCISEEKYQEIKTFIKIPNISNNQVVLVNKKVDINSLSEEEFVALGGFWMYNAKKIIKYRILLGGFYKKEQLLEIYGMKPEYYDKIADDIIISNSKIIQININYIEERELSAHPYFRANIAHSIIEYRNKNGPFKSIEQLREKNLISKTTLEQAKIYLTVK
jgi:DNA uptake protein ComE-like DNA-binding protein